MQKFRFLLIALALCLLLPSCATVEDLPPDMVITPPDTEASLPDAESDVPQGDYRDILFTPLFSKGTFWKNWLFTPKAKIINLETGETFSVCNDPLCTNHNDVSCVQSIFIGVDAIMVSPASTQDDLVIYLGRREAASIVGDQNYQLLRFHFNTGEVTVLAEHLPGPQMLFWLDPKTENIFLSQYLLDDEGNREAFLYVINGKTGKTDILPINDFELSMEYAIGDTVYGSTSEGSYCIDLSQKEPVMKKTEMETRSVYGGYQYYAEVVAERRVWVPDDVIPISEEYGRQPYKDFTEYDLYRVSILQENITPELVAQGITTYGMSENGKYLYYYDFAPQHVVSYFSCTREDEYGMRRYDCYEIGAPDVPEDATLLNVFTKNHAAIHVLDVSTLQEITVIESDEYYLEPFQTCFQILGDGVSVGWQRRDPQAYMGMKTNWDKTYGYLYFNKPYLTFEDTVDIDLSASGF